MARILVADDEPAILDVIQLACSLDGHEVHTFPHPDEAVRGFVDLAPDLMILDVHMTHEGGAEQILERLDTLGGTGSSVVLIVTGGKPSEEAAAFAEQARVKDVIGKPFQLHALRTAVQAALGLPPPPGAKES